MDERLSEENDFASDDRDVSASSEELDSDSTPFADVDDAASEWLGEDLEEAYRRALEANESIESEFELSDFSAEESDGDELSDAKETNRTSSEESVEGAYFQHDAQTTTESDQPSANGDAGDEAANAANDSIEAQNKEEEFASQVSPQQVIEAALFVGGKSLTTKALLGLLRDGCSADAIDEMIASLNQLYAVEGRPYEIRLGEGGYRMVLRRDYERVRNRVYGLGPREVRLTQEALEVLALVAYQQPVTKEQIEARGKENAGNVLRQLLRRELVALERTEGESKRKKDVLYRTTSRFLTLFGLGTIEELPRAEQLDLK